ncbi:MAG: hypothetical protein OXP36_11345 [Gammaproteobacteria bacterium]|nr:hypothetical protein [Gammaproteobacteria bacterium]
MRYLITYDLRANGRNYQTLYDALESIGAKRVLASSWAVRVGNMNAAGIRDWVRQFVDVNDGVLVSPLQVEWAAWSVQADINTI